MGRIKLLALLLALPLTAHASWTYVGTSTPGAPGSATYSVTAGQFVVITGIADSSSSFPLTMTDGSGNVYSSEPTPGSGTSNGNFITTFYLGCAPQTLYTNFWEVQYYGFATHSGAGIAITIPWTAAGTIKYIEADVFSTSYTWAEMDYPNGLQNFAGTNYFASPQSTTPANSDELWVTTGFKLDTTPSMTASTPTATTALTAVGGTSFNYYSIPVGAQTFTYAANSATTCSPGGLEYDSYLIWFSTMGFHGSVGPPAGGSQPHISTWLGN